MLNFKKSVRKDRVFYGFSYTKQATLWSQKVDYWLSQAQDIEKLENTNKTVWGSFLG